jgi:hypothetical protein
VRGARVFARRVFEARAAAAHRHPEPPPSVEVEPLTEARGHSPRSLEDLEAFAAPTREAPVVQTYPEVPRAVFAEDVRPVERRYAVGLGVAPEAARRTLPARQGDGRVVRADPDVAARVLEEPRDVVVGQPVARRVDGDGRRVRQLFQTPHGGEAVEPFAGRHPPLARVILDDDPAAGARIEDAPRQVEADVLEALAVEPVERPLAADDAHAALRPLEDGDHVRVT